MNASTQSSARRCRTASGRPGAAQHSHHLPDGAGFQPGNGRTDGHEMVSGTETFLAKPVDMDELKQTVEEHIRK
jgi:hypothetical protein